jgi:nucleoside 2-deoxyribosyltransferase
MGDRIVFPMDYIPKPIRTPRDYPIQTRTKAIHQIDDCDVLAVVLPRYGMDAAWQIGYAAAKRKMIVGLQMRDDGNHGSAKTLWDHWMHGWTEKDIFGGLPKLRAALKGYIADGILH